MNSTQNSFRFVESWLTVWLNDTRFRKIATVTLLPCTKGLLLSRILMGKQFRILRGLPKITVYGKATTFCGGAELPSNL